MHQGSSGSRVHKLGRVRLVKAKLPPLHCMNAEERDPARDSQVTAHRGSSGFTQEVGEVLDRGFFQLTKIAIACGLVACAADDGNQSSLKVCTACANGVAGQASGAAILPGG